MNWFDENTPLIILDEKKNINIKKISDLYCIESINEIKVWGCDGWVDIEKIEKRLLQEDENMIEIISPCGYFSCLSTMTINGDLANNIKKGDSVKTTWNVPVNIPVGEENKINFYTIGKNIEEGMEIPGDILNTTSANQVLFFGGFYSKNSTDSIIEIDTQCKAQSIWLLARKLCYCYELIYLENTFHKIKRVRTQNKKIDRVELYRVERACDSPSYIYSIIFKQHENVKSYSVNVGVGEICIDIL